MKLKAVEPKAPPSKADPKKDDLKTLPMSEVEKRLTSSPDGLTQAEAAKRLTHKIFLMQTSKISILSL